MRMLSPRHMPHFFRVDKRWNHATLPKHYKDMFNHNKSVSFEGFVIGNIDPSLHFRNKRAVKIVDFPR